MIIKPLRSTANQNTNIAAEVCKAVIKRTVGLTVTHFFSTLRSVLQINYVIKKCFSLV